MSVKGHQLHSEPKATSGYHPISTSDTAITTGRKVLEGALVTAYFAELVTV